MSMPVHLCELTVRAHHTHYAHVTQEIDLTIEGNLEYDDNMRSAEFITTLYPGLYGFTNKKARDKFVRRANAAHDDGEVAYIAAISNRSTDAVDEETEQSYGKASNSKEGNRNAAGRNS